ncbi:putative phytol kinase 2 [Carex littledalei]|uniref:Putative phytol kinase 2 n=1 Tax=Carex littledalei TaxID=544730 RepID=A0A833R6B6_9POAL|nr:putative phytol kinase 2 [Carex littledalei]
MVTHLVYSSLHLSPLRSFPFSSLSLTSPLPSSRFARAGARLRRRPIMAAVLPESTLLHDIGVSALASGKLNRKLVHISVGLVFLLFWPHFSPGRYAPFLAALAPGINSVRMLLLGLGLWKNDAMVKSMSRFGNYRELLKGPLYYACTITLATSLLWRTSPIAIALICNLCAGDGVADIVGRRFGNKKLPYNPSKSYAGTVSMVLAGFIASIGFMYYFHLFGLMQENRNTILGFFLTSLAAAIVESLPISSDLDDNLTVPLTSFLVGSFVF